MKEADFQKKVVFSFSDFFNYLNRTKWKICLLSFMITLCLFGFKLSRPISYTASGVFQCSAETASGMSSLLAKVMGGASFNTTSDKDPKAILCSRTLMEKVVKKLNLQGDLREHHRGNLFSRIKNNLLTEYSHYFYSKKKRPQSSILPKTMVVPDRFLVKEQTPFFACEDICYDKGFFSTLTAHYDPQAGFSIYDEKGRFLGYCQPNTPFLWDAGHFTLVPTKETLPSKQETYTLSLLPLHVAASGLEKTLNVKRDKESRSLLHITYISPHKHLAVSIVNEVMQSYQTYLEQESLAETAKHLQYLKARQQETNSELFALLQKRKTTLEQNIQKGGFAELKHEAAVLSKGQEQYQGELSTLAYEILRIHSAICKHRHLTPSTTVEEVIYRLEDEDPTFISEFEGLDFGNAQSLLMRSNAELDVLSLEIQQYQSLIQAIPDPSFEISHLASVLKDSSLETLYAKTHALQLALLDEKNWSVKEKERIKMDLETQKTFLISHLMQLKKSRDTKLTLIQDKIDHILLYMLHLNVSVYKKTEKQLQHLTSVAEQLPEKWLSEKQISFNSSLSKTIIESLAKMIESKNITQNLKVFNSKPLVLATLPSLPNPPHLRRIANLGFIGTMLLLCGIVFIISIVKGPLASKENLQAARLPVFGPISSKKTDFVSELVLFLESHPQKRKIGIACKNSTSSLLPFLEKKLREENQSFALITLPKNSSSQKIATLLKNISDVRFVFVSSEVRIGSYAFSHFEKSVDLLLVEMSEEPLQPFIEHSFSKPWAACVLEQPKPKEFALVTSFFKAKKRALIRFFLLMKRKDAKAQRHKAI